MGFPHTLNVAAAITVEEYLRGTGNHSVTETAEAAYDLVGYVGYVTLGSAVPAAAPGVATHHTNGQLADAVKALRESHDPSAPQKALPPGTTRAQALGASIPAWLKPLLLKLLTDLLTGALGV